MKACAITRNIVFVVDVFAIIASWLLVRGICFAVITSRLLSSRFLYSRICDYHRLRRQKIGLEGETETDGLN
jgi:hypothetical protein